MIESYKELEQFLDANANRYYDAYPRYTIRFGPPENEYATVHIIENDQTLVVINCFYWHETHIIRAAFVYGDNHRSRPRNWLDLTRALRDTMHSYKRYPSLHSNRVV